MDRILDKNGCYLVIWLFGYVFPGHYVKIPSSTLLIMIIDDHQSRKDYIFELQSRENFHFRQKVHSNKKTITTLLKPKLVFSQ